MQLSLFDNISPTSISDPQIINFCSGKRCCPQGKYDSNTKTLVIEESSNGQQLVTLDKNALIALRNALNQFDL